MSRKGLFVAVVSTLLVLGSSAAGSEGPGGLVGEGIRLQGQGKYEEAVRSFNAALEADQNNALALLELSNTYAAMSQFDHCISTAKRGVELGGELEGKLFAALGSCYMSDGKTKKAVRTYKRGLDRRPDEALLNYSLAVALEREFETKDALSYVVRAIEQEPSEASPYFLLGRLYSAEGDHAAALLGYMRFLSLDPNGRRSSTASVEVFRSLQAGVTQRSARKSGGEIKLASATDKGVLEALESGRKRAASSFYLAGESKGDPQLSVGALTNFVQACADLPADQVEEVFLWKYLARVPVLMQQDEVFESFAYVLAARAGVDGAYDWLTQHPREIDRLNRTNYK